jgi:hypothetical protein
MKAAFNKLLSDSWDQLWITLYSALNRQMNRVTGIPRKDVSRSSASSNTSKPHVSIALVESNANLPRVDKMEISQDSDPVNTSVKNTNVATAGVSAVNSGSTAATIEPQSLNDYFQWKTDTKGSVIGVLTNLSSFVIAYGDYRAGKYEFGHTTLDSTGPLDEKVFLFRLLYVLLVPPEQIVHHCLAKRSEGATAMSGSDVIPGLMVESTGFEDREPKRPRPSDANTKSGFEGATRSLTVYCKEDGNGFELEECRVSEWEFEGDDSQNVEYASDQGSDSHDWEWALYQF